MGRVLVAGSVNMDVVATTPRPPRPGETVLGHQVHFFPGGKGANQAVAARRAGALVALLGRLGTDPFGVELRAFLEGAGLDLTDTHAVPDVATGTAVIVVSDDGENSIVVIPGANATLSEQDVAAVALGPEDVLVCQLEVPLATVLRCLRGGRETGARTVLNPAPAQELPPGMIDATDILVVNETELDVLLGRSIDPTPEAASKGARELRVREDQTVVVTRGRHEVVALGPFGELRIPARSVEVVDTTGAGDCFVGSMAARLAEGEELGVALTYAVAAAALCVQKIGAGPSMPDEAEVRELLRDSR